METVNKTKPTETSPKVKVVGQIDLDSINDATRPARKTKEEREAERQQKDEQQAEYNREFAIRSLEQKREKLQQELNDVAGTVNDLRKRISSSKPSEEHRQLEIRLAYLQEKQAVRERYNNLTMTNDERQKTLTIQGIRPKKMDVVHFHVPKACGRSEEMDGIALVRDENHYYMALGLYEQNDQDNMTTMMDSNPDCTFDGIWPKYTVLKPALKYEERLMRNLTDKYADELETAEEFVLSIQKQEASEIASIQEKLAADFEARLEQELSDAENKAKQLNADLLATDAELRRRRQDAGAGAPDEPTVGKDILDFSFDEADYEPLPPLGLDSPSEQKYHHLPYVRGHRNMLTMNWPEIEDTYESWLRFRLMANIARLVSMLRGAHALTYVLTGEYYEELTKRGREYYKGMRMEDLVPSGEVSCGVLVYPSQGFQDTILYRIDNRNQLSILVAYLREDKLMFYESYSMQEVINRPRTDHFICHSLKGSGTEPSRLFGWIRNLLVSHLAMEHDMERIVRNLVEEEKGSATETDIHEQDNVDTTDDHDILIRDADWYTALTVSREIPVRGYLSHRWCGSGKDKYIREVWVRPHVKHGYTRTANVKKQ